MALLNITTVALLRSRRTLPNDILEHITTFRTLSTRGLSKDNTINIIFGILASALGILSVAFAWYSARWTAAGRGLEDDGK
jgi:hypothetical protein